MGEAKRRQAALRSLGDMSLEEHANDLRVRAASEFRRRGEVRHRLEAVTEGGEVFEIDTSWRDRDERNIFYRTLPGVFRRRGVKRYVSVAEAWGGGNRAKGILPSEDPDRTEIVLVVAVDRGGERRKSYAEIKRGGDRPALAEWKSESVEEGWLANLLDGADADPNGQPSVTPVLVDADPDVVDRMMELDREIIEEIQRLHRPGEDWAALAGLMATIAHLFSRPVFNMGLRQYAQDLRDRPDIYPIAPTRLVDRTTTSAGEEKHLWRYHDPIADILRGHDEEVVFNAVMHVMVIIGVSLMGGPRLANWLEGLAAQDEAA